MNNENNMNPMVPNQPVMPGNVPQSNPVSQAPVAPVPQPIAVPQATVMPQAQVPQAPVGPVAPVAPMPQAPVAPVAPMPQPAPVPQAPQPAPVPPVSPQPSVGSVPSTPGVIPPPQGNPVPPVAGQPMGQPVSTPQASTSQASTPKKKKPIVLIIALVVAIAIVGVSLYFTFFRGNNNQSEPENVENKEEVKEEKPVSKEEETTVTFHGFEFEKLEGYKYEVTENLIIISDDNQAIAISNVTGDMATIKTTVANIKTAMEQDKLTVGATKTATYAGKEMITYEVAKEDLKGLYFVVQSPDAKNVFEGVITNTSNTVDYNSLEVVAKIVDSAKVKDTIPTSDKVLGSSLDIQKRN